MRGYDTEFNSAVGMSASCSPSQATDNGDKQHTKKYMEPNVFLIGSSCTILMNEQLPQ